MKHLNKLSYIGLFVIFSFAISSNTNAMEIINSWRQHHPKPVKPSPVKPKKPIGAPLDAGLLSILGAAGVGYYLLRRRNNKEK